MGYVSSWRGAGVEDDFNAVFVSIFDCRSEAKSSQKDVTVIVVIGDTFAIILMIMFIITMINHGYYNFNNQYEYDFNHDYDCLYPCSLFANTFLSP